MGWQPARANLAFDTGPLIFGPAVVVPGHPGLSAEGTHGGGIAECRAGIGHAGPFGPAEHLALRLRRLHCGHQPVGAFWRHVGIVTDAGVRGVARPAAGPTLRLPALTFAGGRLREPLWAAVLGRADAGEVHVSLVKTFKTFGTILHHVFATGHWVPTDSKNMGCVSARHYYYFFPNAPGLDPGLPQLPQRQGSLLNLPHGHSCPFTKIPRQCYYFSGSEEVELYSHIK